MMTLPLVPHSLSPDISIRRTAVRRALPFWLGYAFVLFFTLAPLLLLGKGISLPLLDWLDGDITGKVLLGRNLMGVRDYFSPQVPQMMRGAAMWSNAPSTLLYAWLTPFSAYVAECFLAVSAAYWGMALFLRRVLTLVTGSPSGKDACANLVYRKGRHRGHAQNSGARRIAPDKSLPVHRACADSAHADSARPDGERSSSAHQDSICAAATSFAPPFPLALLCACVAVLFACLPFYTVHDLTTMGIPLVLWAFLVLWTAGQDCAQRRARTQRPGTANAKNANRGRRGDSSGLTNCAGLTNCVDHANSTDYADCADLADCADHANFTYRIDCAHHADSALSPRRTSPALVGAAYGAVFVFGACSTLAFSGYFILGFLALFFLVQAVRRRFAGVRHLALAFALLCALYGAANLGLVQSLFAPGDSGFVSHRTIYAPGTPAAGEVFSEFKTMLLHGQYHAGSKHLAALACAVLILGAALLLWKRLDKAQRRLWLFCACLLGGGVLIAAFYAFCGTAAYARFVALLGPAIASFQFERVYFLYPTLWYTLLAGAVLLMSSAVFPPPKYAVNRFAAPQERGTAKPAAGDNAQAFAVGSAPDKPVAAAADATDDDAPAPMPASTPAAIQTHRPPALAAVQAQGQPQQTPPKPPQGASRLPRAAAVLVLAACFAFVLRGNYLTGNWQTVLTGEQPANTVTWRQFFAEDLFDDIRAALSTEDGIAPQASDSNRAANALAESAIADASRKPATAVLASSAAGISKPETSENTGSAPNSRSDISAGNASGSSAAPVVVSLGISPAIALYNGFSTLDGYSNNYALSYHEQFGRVLRDEISKDAALASYFYDWGNRCYLFTPQLGADFSYRRDAPDAPRKPLTDLAFDWQALREMGGTHVLSIAPIADCAQYGLTDCGKFAGDEYDLYVYAL